MKNENINFHQTFYPNFDYIGKILSISDSLTFRTINEISMLTGIPTGESSGKVLPHIKYCEFMYLIESETINGTIKFKKTSFGELITKEDPYFSERTSRLICHMFLTSPNIGSGLWYFICRVLQSKYGNKVDKVVIEHDILERFGIATKLTPFNSCYSNEQSLGNLEMISTEGDIIEFLDLTYEDELFYAFIYSLYLELKNYDQNRSEYTADEIFHKLKWNYSLNWSENKTMRFLENASENGWLIINRQLKPITIIITRNTKEIASLIYSELI